MKNYVYAEKTILFFLSEFAIANDRAIIILLVYYSAL
jgi:hypothetical protein